MSMLPPILHPHRLLSLRLRLYRWEFRDGDVDLLRELSLQRRAAQCTRQLLPLLTPVLERHLPLSPSSEASYLLTLLMCARKMEGSPLSSRLARLILPHLSSLPSLRLKTHLQAHLSMALDSSPLFHEAHAAATSWPPASMSEEDWYIHRYLVEEYALVHGDKRFSNP